VTLTLAASSCVPAVDRASWYEAFVMSGPCYEVDLTDGLSSANTDEVHALFDCINARGQFDALEPVMVAGDADTRAGEPAWIELVLWTEALLAWEVDPFSWAGGLADALTDPDAEVDRGLDLVLELVYGQRITMVRGGAIDLDDPAALRAGVVWHAAPVVDRLADLALDDDLRLLDGVSDALRDPATHRAVGTAVALIHATHPDVRSVMPSLLTHTGDLIAATRTPDDDLWAGATGDSLRDLLDAAVLADDPWLLRFEAPARALLDEPDVRARLYDQLLVWEARGDLERLPSDLVWFTSIDAQGAPLGPGGDSALVALIRLLRATHQPMQCSLDLWITDLEIDLGDLAVALLSTFADLDPAALSDGLGVVSSLLGWEISGLVLDEIATSGVCPVLTPQVVEDLGALDRLAEPEAAGLVTVFLDLVRVARDGDADRLDALVDLVAALDDPGVTGPVEELIRDAGGAALVADVIVLVPALIDPVAYGVAPPRGEPYALADLVDALPELWARDEDGLTGWERAEPWLRPVLEDDATWALIGSVGALLAQPTSTTAGAIDLVPPSIDPETYDVAAAFVEDRALVAPLLRVVESQLVDALLDPTPPSAGGDAPIVFVVRIVLDGVLQQLLVVVDVVLGGESPS
jgi:hypothetical protein